MNEAIIVFVAGAMVGYALALYGHKDTVKLLKETLHDSRTNERQATDRLLAAWKDDAKIPPRPNEPPPQLDPLPPAMIEYLGQWEDPEHKAAIEQRFRQKIGRGMDAVRAILEEDDIHPTGATRAT